MRLKAIAVALVGVSAVAAGPGCGGAASHSRATGAATTVGAPGATVAFVTPQDGSTVGLPLAVRVRLGDFRLAPGAVGTPAKQGEGHLHFSLDGGKYDYPKYSGPNGREAEKLGVQGRYSPATSPTIVYASIPPGPHTLVVHLANNDHSDTGVEGSTSFTVVKGRPPPEPVPAGGSGSGY